MVFVVFVQVDVRRMELNDLRRAGSLMASTLVVALAFLV
jgi:hypothetical protein